MKLSLSSIAKDPTLARYEFTAQSAEFILRPLEKTDVNKLHSFLNDLSAETRRFSTFDGYDLKAAKKLVDAINKYDKLRLVIEVNTSTVIGLVEFSFDIPDSDMNRYRHYNIDLNETVCRFGPTLADNYQGSGIGKALMPYIIDIACRFEKSKIILWGGVLVENTRAIKFYERHNFSVAGTYYDGDVAKLDMILEL